MGNRPLDMKLAGRSRLLKIKYIRAWACIWLFQAFSLVGYPINVFDFLTPEEFIAVTLLLKSIITPMLFVLTLRRIERLDLAFGILSVGSGMTLLTFLNNAIVGDAGIRSLSSVAVYCVVLYLHFTVAHEPDPEITVIETMGPDDG